jgi:hypothetical protein
MGLASALRVNQKSLREYKPKRLFAKGYPVAPGIFRRQRAAKMLNPQEILLLYSYSLGSSLASQIISTST